MWVSFPSAWRTVFSISLGASQRGMRPVKFCFSENILIFPLYFGRVFVIPGLLLGGCSLPELWRYLRLVFRLPLFHWEIKLPVLWVFSPRLLLRCLSVLVALQHIVNSPGMDEKKSRGWMGKDTFVLLWPRMPRIVFHTSPGKPWDLLTIYPGALGWWVFPQQGLGSDHWRAG